MKKRSFIRGTVAGVILGAIAGILLAPKSGKETQADLKRKLKGTSKDVYDRLEKLSGEIGGKVDDLKSSSKELRGEAKEESQELIRRAEVLKQDLRISAANLAKGGANAKDSAIKQVKLLINEGQAVLTELERVTKHLAASAKDKMNTNGKED